MKRKILRTTRMEDLASVIRKAYDFLKGKPYEIVGVSTLENHEFAVVEIRAQKINR